MSISNKHKKTICLIPITVIILISIFITLLITAFIYEPATMVLPSKVVEMFLLYDHIEYNGIDYYFYESSQKQKGITPDFDKEIRIIIANSDCRPYGKNTVSAYLCKNDSDNTYIYYDSCFYVSDKSLASEPWNK